MAETLYARSSQIIKTINKYNERENSIEDRKELTKELNSYDFTGLTFWNINFSNLDLRFKDFSYSNFHNCFFANAQLDETVFNGCLFWNSYFYNCSLRKAKFINSILSNCEIAYGTMFGITIDSECDYDSLRIRDTVMSDANVPPDFLDKTLLFSIPKTYNGFIGKMELENDLIATVIIKPEYRCYRNTTISNSLVCETVYIQSIEDKNGSLYDYGEVKSFGTVSINKTYTNENFEMNIFNFHVADNGFLIYI